MIIKYILVFMYIYAFLWLLFHALFMPQSPGSKFIPHFDSHKPAK